MVGTTLADHFNPAFKGEMPCPVTSGIAGSTSAFTNWEDRGQENP